jgi:hypothetical protein
MRAVFLDFLGRVTVRLADRAVIGEPFRQGVPQAADVDRIPAAGNDVTTADDRDHRGDTLTYRHGNGARPGAFVLPSVPLPPRGLCDARSSRTHDIVLQGPVW